MGPWVFPDKDLVLTSRSLRFTGNSRLKKKRKPIELINKRRRQKKNEFLNYLDKLKSRDDRVYTKGLIEFDGFCITFHDLFWKTRMFGS